MVTVNTIEIEDRNLLFNNLCLTNEETIDVFTYDW